ncbi:MAG: hypothetical protein ACLRIT_07655 [Blautia sp.]
MGNFEYRDLAPIDNIENGDKHIEALNWAFQNKKVKKYCFNRLLMVQARAALLELFAQ